MQILPFSVSLISSSIIYKKRCRNGHLELAPIEIVSDWPDEKQVKTEGSDEDEDESVKQFDSISNNSRSMANINKPLI